MLHVPFASTLPLVQDGLSTSSIPPVFDDTKEAFVTDRTKQAIVQINYVIEISS